MEDITLKRKHNQENALVNQSGDLNAPAKRASPDSPSSNPSEEQEMSITQSALESIQLLTEQEHLFLAAIDDLLTAGLGSIDAMKATFEERINSLKESVASQCQVCKQDLAEKGAAAVQVQDQLFKIRGLISSLNLQVDNPTTEEDLDE